LEEKEEKEEKRYARYEQGVQETYRERQRGV
jgi:hypothetical protein